MNGGVRSSEFWLASLVVLCATGLLLAGEVSEDTWKWAVTVTGGAYVGGRSLVKASNSWGPTNISTTIEETVTPVSNVVNMAEELPKQEDPASGVDAIREALERNADALSALRDDLQP